MSDGSHTKFALKINGGRERTIVAASGAYIDVVAAVPAMFGVERDAWPVRVEVWSPDVGASAPHHYMVIEEDQFGRTVVGVAR